VQRVERTTKAKELYL